MRDLLRALRIITLALLGGAAVVLVIVLVLSLTRGADASLLRTEQIASCKAGAKTTVASLDFDYYIYSADAASAKAPGMSDTQRNIRATEARNLQHEDELRAVRVDISALSFTGEHRLIDPKIRAVVARTDFRCSRQYR